MKMTYLKRCSKSVRVIVRVWSKKNTNDLLKPFEKKPEYLVPKVGIQNSSFGNILVLSSLIEDTTNDFTDTNIGITEAVKDRLINLYDSCRKYCGDVHNWIPEGSKLYIAVEHCDIHSPIREDSWIIGEDCGGWDTASMLEAIVESLRNGEPTYLY